MDLFLVIIQNVSYHTDIFLFINLCFSLVPAMFDFVLLPTTLYYQIESNTTDI